MSFSDLEKKYLEGVRVQLVCKDKGARTLLRTTLENVGLRSVETVSDLDELTRLLPLQPPDLLILDAVSGATAPEYIHELRHRWKDMNAFVPILALTGVPTAERVKALVDSGADDLLIEPYTSGQIFERLSALVDRRKPFVVTRNYIGPDRRKAARGLDVSRLPMIVVPNMLKERVENTLNMADVGEAVSLLSDVINEVRLHRMGDQAVWLSKELDKTFERWRAGEVDQEFSDSLERIQKVCEETTSRLIDAQHPGIRETAASLSGVAGKVLDAGNVIEKKNLDAIRELAHQLKDGMKPSSSQFAEAAVVRYSKKEGIVSAKLPK